MHTNYKYFDEKGAHLHTFNEQPLYGTSTVVQIISKPLTWWAAELAAVECLEAGEKIPTIRAEYEEAAKQTDKKAAIDALMKKYPIFKTARFAHFTKKNKAADTGTDMHEELEKYVKMYIRTNQGMPMKVITGISAVDEFSKWATENVKKFLISEGHCYSEELWTGGITDCMAVMKDESIAIIDFKSSKEAYDSQFIQVAGYDIEQSENGIFDANGERILEPQKVAWYYIIPFGAPEFIAIGKTASQEFKDGFRAAVTLHKLINK